MTQPDGGHTISALEDVGVCANHPQRAASYACRTCHKRYCNDCVSLRPVSDRVLAYCPACGARCDGLATAGPKTFLAGLADAFVYPLRGRGKFLLLVAGPFFWMLSLFACVPFVGLAISLLILFYLAAYMSDVAGESARGEPDPPDWPDLSLETARPALLFAAATIVGFLPAIAWRVAAYAGAGEPGVPLAAWIASILYIPMAWLAVVMFDGPLGVSPHIVLPAIVRVAPRYVLACGVLSLSVFLQVRVEEALAEVLPLVSGLFIYSVGLYFLMVDMRILGLIYLFRKDALKWQME
jgi:hypothetical protein